MQASNLIITIYSTAANAATSQTDNTPPAAPPPLHGSIGDLLASRWLEIDTYRELVEHLITTVIFVGIALLIGFLLESLVRGLCQIALRRSPGSWAQAKKIETLRSILLSVARYTVACVAVFKILLLWGVSAQSLTVGSAIIAGAVGFGSQGLVQDMITGFSLLFEDQLQIGNYVQIGDKTGYVREVGLRIVKLESLDGTEHILFNRSISMVSNLKPPTSDKTPGFSP